MFVEHWQYQRLLDRCARRVLRGTRDPLNWLGNVKHEAMLLLARQLRRSLKGPIDRVPSDSAFPAWLAVVTRRHCQEALRRLRGGRRGCRQLLDDDIAEQRIDPDALLDLRLAIDRLAHPQPRRWVSEYLPPPGHEVCH